MPWPRRSNATSRNSSASALSYCFAQHRWFCDQPWMNRIGGPSGSPHSRTCSRRPPPPVTVWISHRCSVWPSSSSRPPRLVGPERSSPRRRRAHRAADLILARGLPYLRPRGACRQRRDTGAMQARASAAFVGRARELEELERALDAAQAGAARRSSSPGRRASARPGWPPRSRGAPATAGFEVLLGRSIDLVGTELPYQPFAEALRPLGRLREARGSQLRVFEDGARAARRARGASRRCCSCSRTCTGPTRRRSIWSSSSPTTSTTGGCCCSRPSAGRAGLGRARAPARRRRAALGLGARARARAARAARSSRRCSRRAGRAAPAALADAIVARSEGNPFFAEELLAAAGADGGELPRAPARPAAAARRRARPRRRRACCALAAAAGRDVAYPLLARRRGAARARRARVAARGGRARRARRRPGDGQVPLPPRAARGGVYATILPGEREELHARLADELARSGAAGPARAGAALGGGRAQRRRRSPPRSRRRARRRPYSASPRRSATSSGRSRCGTRCRTPPTLAGLDLAELCAWAAELASQVGAAPRAVELGRRAIELAGARRPAPCARSCTCASGEYLYATGSDDAALAALERAVELVPAEPPSPERAYALGSLAGGLMVAWRYAESLAIAEQALALARDVGAGEAEVRALTVLGSDLAYLGRGEEGSAASARRCGWPSGSATTGPGPRLRQPHRRADMLGRPGESAQVAQEGSRRCAGTASTAPLLVANRIEALLALGDWDEANRSAPRRSAASPRASSTCCSSCAPIWVGDRTQHPRFLAGEQVRRQAWKRRLASVFRVRWSLLELVGVRPRAARKLDFLLARPDSVIAGDLALRAPQIHLKRQHVLAGLSRPPLERRVRNEASVPVVLALDLDSGKARRKRPPRHEMLGFERCFALSK